MEGKGAHQKIKTTFEGNKAIPGEENSGQREDEKRMGSRD
jgi:hypothetical protein